MSIFYNNIIPPTGIFCQYLINRFFHNPSCKKNKPNRDGVWLRMIVIFPICLAPIIQSAFFSSCFFHEINFSEISLCNIFPWLFNVFCNIFLRREESWGRGCQLGTEFVAFSPCEKATNSVPTWQPLP